MTLFDMIDENKFNSSMPLAQRMKPTKFDDFFGQEDILSDGMLLRRLVDSDTLTSIILFGPSGTGKSSLAKIISNKTKRDFISINAVTSGVGEVRDVIKKAKDSIEKYGVSTILFIDEIHRFNKSQQDALLSCVEDGIITLIGATTENPFYEINSALISRSIIFELKKLKEIDIVNIINNAIKTDEILIEKNIKIKKDALEFLANKADGDARHALNVLEIAVFSQDKNMIELGDIKKSLQLKHINYDKNGDSHYDTISAFIKSVRGSDVDASLYYLSKMLVAGEDVKFIARRLVILAAEDIGLADTNALILANNAFDAVNKIGMPESRIILSEVTIYLARARKSNSAYLAIDSAIDYVKNNSVYEIPLHLQDFTKKKLQGIESKYLYPHDFENSIVKQDYLPKNVDKIFYKELENDFKKD